MMASDAPRFVLEIARRWGKTFLLVVVAIETCLRNPGSRVVYGAPTLKHLQEFILPTFEKVIEDAPADCRPRWDAQAGHWRFPVNGPARGSYVHLFGADDKRKANRGRGPEARLAIFDEAGFTPPGLLSYILRSIFRPQLLRPGEKEGGRTFLGSTPAEQPDHDFTAIAERAEANGNYARRTIYDNPRLTPERVRAFIEEDAKEEGLSVEDYKQTDEFRREYLAERVVNKLLVVVPEWEAKRATLIRDVPRPEYFRAQTVLDFGGADPHAVHFAYWHPKLNAYVVEDELLLKEDQNTAELALAVKKKEEERWGVKGWDGTLAVAREGVLRELLDQVPEWMQGILSADAKPQPWSRVADNNLQLVRDLYELHQLAFIPTQKDNKQLQVNNLRVLIRQEQFIISKRCVHTDRHLRATTWKDHKRKDFTRRAGEHGDLVDTSVYGVRNVDRRDPTPLEAMAPPPEATIGERIRALERQARTDLGQTYMGNSRLGARLLNARRKA